VRVVLALLDDLPRTSFECLGHQCSFGCDKSARDLSL
jgi:hypothetical protein